jgi:hypothetical protein
MSARGERLNFLFWNCCGGLGSKMDSVWAIIEKYNPECFFISESEVSVESSTWLQCQNYTLHCSNTIKNKKSRLICFLRNNSEFKIILPDTLTEIIAIENQTSRIIGVYRPFKLLEHQTKESALDDFFNTITDLSITNKVLYVAGDFNARLDKSCPETTRLIKWQDDQSLTQFIKTNTWMRTITLPDGTNKIRKSRLDLLFSTKKEVQFELGDRWTSDHSMIILRIMEQPLQRIKTKVRSWKKYTAANIQITSRCLVDSIPIEDRVTSDSLCEAITNSLLSAYDEICPIRTVRISKPSDIVSDDIERIKKKRKRALHKFNKTKDQALLQKIKDLDKKLKLQINKTRKHIINKKMTSANKKSFWDTIKKLQGDRGISKDEITLNTGSDIIKGPSDVANEFATFFQEKVCQLSEDSGMYQWARQSPESLDFTEKDIETAIASLKTKMCSGLDGLPLKIVKHSAPAIKSSLLELMKLASKSIPLAWKKSLITPLHKSGERNLTKNYRPIANLPSLSKIFEKLVLARLDGLYPDIEGQHQHGFRQKRSTVTALLELQHEIATALDQNKIVSTYSIDMSAAFDLLKPSVFHLIAPLDPPMMDILLDFLSGRTFTVKVGEAFSEMKTLSVGCVQGSILGPKLFGIYCRDLPTALPEGAKLITYADDSYVVNASKTIEDLKNVTEAAIAKHTAFLRSIGMVVNSSKTELLLSSRRKNQESMVIECDNVKITPSDSMKALGVYLTPSLSWDKHIDSILNRTAFLIHRTKYLARWLKKEDLLKLITSQYYSIIYYAAPIWIGSLTSKAWSRLNAAHYRALRACLKDYKRRRSKRDLNLESKRATPAEWGMYSVVSTVIKLYNSSNTNISNLIRQSAYVNDRLPRRAKFIDRSRLVVGRQSIYNRIGPLFAKISFDWIGDMSDDELRVKLKKEFFSL